MACPSEEGRRLLQQADKLYSCLQLSLLQSFYRLLLFMCNRKISARSVIKNYLRDVHL